MVDFRISAYDSDAYRQLLALRVETLRKPLGLTFSEEHLALDVHCKHLGLWQAHEPVAVCMLMDVGEGVVKLRGMGVHPAWQGNGMGRRLLAHAEAFAKENGWQRITLHARRYAEGFYARCGYVAIGHEFLEIGLPHIVMEKDLPTLP